MDICFDTHESYEKWVENGCKSEKWDAFKNRRSTFIKAVVRIITTPFLMLWHITAFKFEEYWRKTLIFFQRMLLGYDYEYCTCGYLCAQECFSFFRLTHMCCDWCRLLFCIRDALWCINPISKVSYRLAAVDLSERLVRFLDEMDFATEIMRNFHDMEEINNHRNKLYEELKELRHEFKVAIKGGKHHE